MKFKKHSDGNDLFIEFSAENSVKRATAAIEIQVFFY